MNMFKFFLLGYYDNCFVCKQVAGAENMSLEELEMKYQLAKLFMYRRLVQERFMVTFDTFFPFENYVLKQGFQILGHFACQYFYLNFLKSQSI